MKKIIPVLLLFFLLGSCNHDPESKSISVEYPFLNPELGIEERVNDLVSRLSLEEKCMQMLDVAPAIERLGIPEYYWWNESLHGVARSGRATVFPQAIGLAASFDPELVQTIASVIGMEARAKYNAARDLGNSVKYSYLTFWSPNVNIFRDPRWGRGQETYGEDPFLSGKIGAAFVKGLQGDDPDHLKAAACAKHYVVHSGPEALRHEFNAISSPRDLMETYLPAFKQLSDAGVEGFMCAYNRTNNEACCGSSYLLQDILRNEWGFKGYITSDCGAISNFHGTHKLTATPQESAALALRSGVNLNCGNNFYPYLITAVEEGLITEKEIDIRLAELLKTRFRLGLFDPKENDPYKDYGPEIINSRENRDLARIAAEKSMVLLKNNGILPLPESTKDIYVVGPHANNNDVLMGNYYGTSDNMVTYLEGINRIADPGASISYNYGFLPYRKNINPMDWSTGVAKTADVTLIFAGISGLLEGEEGESVASPYSGDRLDYGLPDNQIEYLKKMREGGGKNMVLILTGGSPVDIKEAEPYVDAVIYAWYAGEEGGNALANILFGRVNPSGRLPITFPESYEQLPEYADYRMKGRTYKYMDEDPAFPFGFGLSYTSFEYQDLRIGSKEDSYYIEVYVENTGELSGEEVVQLYLSFPEEAEEAPNIRMIGLSRISLEAGKKGKVSFEIEKSALMLFDGAGNEIFIPGNYTFIAGGASPLKRSMDLGISFTQENIIISGN